LKPKDGDRIADVPHGQMTTSLARLSECGLTRVAFERIGIDRPYAEALAGYMLSGYDSQKAAEATKEALRTKWKNPKQFTVTHSVNSDQMLRALCARVADDPDSFLCTAGLSFVRALLPRGREQAQLAKLRTELPVPPANGHAYPMMDASTLASWGIIGAAHKAIEYLENPRAAYISPTMHHGLWRELVEHIRSWANELGTYNPALLLEYLGIGIARLIAEGSPRRAAHITKEIFKDAQLVTLGGTPEDAIGVQIAQNCSIALEWFALRQAFPDPTQYQYSLRVCCNQMYIKWGRPSPMHDAIISGELAVGISVVWNLKEHDSLRAYFCTCPYCKAPLFVPEGASVYEELSGDLKSKLNPFVWSG